jgi:ATP-dependent exoDNAse (exonuclease V) beta subunit
MAKIGTIHSLCESILKSFAFQASLEPEFEQLDDISRATLQDISAKSALLQAISEQTEEHELLLKYPWELLHEWLELILSSPLRYLEATKTFDNLDKETFQTSLKKLLRVVQLRSLRKFLSNPALHDLHASLSNLADTDEITNLGDFRKQTLLRLNTLTQNPDFALDDNILTDLWKSVLALAEESVGHRGSRKDEANFLRAKLRAVKEMAETCCAKKADFHIPAEINEADLEIWHPTRLLMLFAHRALVIYEQNKLSKGVDYDDLIGKVVNALAEEESNIKAHYQR